MTVSFGVPHTGKRRPTEDTKHTKHANHSTHTGFKLLLAAAAEIAASDGSQKGQRTECPRLRKRQRSKSILPPGYSKKRRRTLKPGTIVTIKGGHFGPDCTVKVYKGVIVRYDRRTRRYDVFFPATENNYPGETNPKPQVCWCPRHWVKEESNSS